jgi:hypothetical protein
MENNNFNEVYKFTEKGMELNEMLDNIFASWLEYSLMPIEEFLEFKDAKDFCIKENKDGTCYYMAHYINGVEYPIGASVSKNNFDMDCTVFLQACTLLDSENDFESDFTKVCLDFLNSIEGE